MDCPKNNYSLFFLQANVERRPLEEMAAAEEKGAFSCQPPRTDDDDDQEEQFQEAAESQPARTQVSERYRASLAQFSVAKFTVEQQIINILSV